MDVTREEKLASPYAGIVVAVDLTAGGEARVRLAGDLARRFSAKLIGVAAQERFTPLFFEFPTGLEPTQLELEEREAAQQLRMAETIFHRAAGPCRGQEWHSAFASESGFVAQFVARCAHAADLIVIGQPPAGDAEGPRMAADPGDLVMTAGRPILVVPPGVETLSAERIVVGWRDTRESRRAVSDALPFLKRAQHVTLVTVGETGAEASAADVGRWLGDHGVVAHVLARPHPPGTIARELLDVARENGADLLVSGAYGHSRTREWIFGGVTKELLGEASICCLMSH